MGRFNNLLALYRLKSGKRISQDDFDKLLQEQFGCYNQKQTYILVRYGRRYKSIVTRISVMGMIVCLLIFLIPILFVISQWSNWMWLGLYLSFLGIAGEKMMYDKYMEMIGL